MATPASTQSAQGVIKIFTFTSIADNDTFVGPVGPKGYWANSESTTVGADVTYSAGTYTFHVGGTAALTLFVIV